MPTNRLVEKEVISTYANVLYEGVFEAGGQDMVLEVRDEVDQAIRHIRTNMQLADTLKDTSYTPEQKAQVVRGVFEGLNPVLIDVLVVMTERENISLLRQVWEAYEAILEEKLNVVVVDVTTMVELDEKLRSLITEKVKSDLGKNVVLREHIDPSILGGIIMSAQGKRIDASVLSQLESARGVLKTTTDGGEC